MSASRAASALSELSPEPEMEMDEKPRTRAKTTPKKATTATPTTRQRAATKKATSKTAATAKASKVKSAPGTTKKSKTTAPRPSWKDIIRECIADNKDDARVGVSRSTIKKFAEENYGVELNASSLFQLGRAIASGTESGIFVLPKGPSGKVKLAPKTTRPPVSKENSKPPSKTPKPTSKAASKKTVTKTTKKESGAKKTTSSASKRNSAKKTVTRAAPAVKAKAVAAKKTGRKAVARK